VCPVLAETASEKVDLRREGTGLPPSDGIGDIMAHQLKFIACIKIMVDELSTLATGFEVDGGQLRYQLYIWLEKEVEVLKRLSSYGMDSDAHRDPSHSKRLLSLPVIGYNYNHSNVLCSASYNTGSSSSSSRACP